MRKSALLWFGLVVMVLMALGLVILTSASESNAFRLYGDPYFFIKRQVMYLVPGVALAVAVACFDYHKWRQWEGLTWVALAVVLLLLLAVFHFEAVKGSHRWIKLGPVRLQPSEFAKLMMVITMSVWLDKAAWKVELFWRGAFWPAVLIGLIAAPILMEPDFGSTMVVACVGGLLMIVGGTKFLHLALFIPVGLAVFLYKLLTNANRVRRLLGFFGDDVVNAVLGLMTKMGLATTTAEGVDSAAYQAQMSLAAIANSEIWGAGLGQSMQKYAYLPENHTDFIFAIGAEELGIVFSISVVLLFVAFFALAVYIARKASDRFGRFLVIGMAFIIFFQAIFNIGVVCKALPTKGMALPFFSYGGTNLLSACFAVGTILSVGIHSYREKKHALMSRVFVGRR